MELSSKTRGESNLSSSIHVVAFLTSQLLFEFSIWARIYFRGSLITRFFLFVCLFVCFFYLIAKNAKLSTIIIHSKYFPDSDWLKAHV